MAKKNFTNMKSLLAYLDAQAKDIVKNKNGAVAEEAIETGKERVQTDVYDAYPNPIQYVRTGELKNDSWEIHTTADGIMIFNNREDGDKQVAHIVQSGIGYTQDFPFNGVPRPFIDNMAEELQKNGALSKAFVDDLRKRGFNVL